MHPTGAAPTPVWSPTHDDLAGTRLGAFQLWLGSQRGLYLCDYGSLWHWSVTDLEGFWSAVWEFFEVGPPGAYEAVLTGEHVAGAVWFAGAELNFAEYLLRQGGLGDVAVIGVGEEGASVTMTRAGLRAAVASFAGALTRLGVGTGDRVVGYLPNIPEAVVAFLAAASLGAVWSSIGQDYAPAAVVERFAQLDPVVLVAADGYRYAGRDQPRTSAVTQIREALPTLRHTVMISRLGSEETAPDTLAWEDLLATQQTCAPVNVPFSHPLWVLFSSGTTGLPKGIVHGHGGVLLEQLKSLGLHWDLQPQDRFLWFTSPSWVMWNLLVSGLATGSAIVTYDGSPTHPDPAALWRIVAQTGATVFGTSPAYLQACRDAGIRPRAAADLSDVRALGTTGSPLAPSTHLWMSEEVPGVPLFSMSGGTDVVGAFCGGAPSVPVYVGEMSVRNLGVALEAWNDDGRPVVDQVGELVVTRPMPSMPLYLWGDASGERYREAYFSTFEGVWRHGDWITVTSRGTVLVHGRSDSTLNRNGVRMGSSDIYHALEGLPEVVEALVVGVEQSDGSYWMPLFVVLREGRGLDAATQHRIKEAIRENASPRHVPDEILQVAGLPHTRTGKKLEVPVKRLLQGAAPETVVQPGAVDDPSLLEPFYRLGRERTALR